MQLPHLVHAAIFSTTGNRTPRAVSRSAILKTSFGHMATQMPQPSAPLQSCSLTETTTCSIATPKDIGHKRHKRHKRFRTEPRRTIGHNKAQESQQGFG